MAELGREESHTLLASVSMAVGFTQALPATASASEVVVHEADRIDEDTRSCWSVMVTGTASRVTDPQALLHYRAEFTPWFNLEMKHVLRIRAELVTRYRPVRSVADSPRPAIRTSSSSGPCSGGG
ncbi:pyridoxamine 5'-phosphate oxidase family protein [Streptomyces sp. NPDC001401]|uniref:pyridoxamine 5'-phosphate oxidase family protein n=1 Tax=Streptomyces sp. NPDC001401 TaxID=3364570 RepID=UPI00367806E0